ncbi:CDP-alcohol phosphatidyltransferase [Ruminiclostridium papyrosolvens DSM 2782]|uniref:CDP-diacylglycerol--glycerol-3-phosphate 3-phosphatidyltransferase n=1 Tax=Ruminiclostridium papyrosolvens DSM 2782 TaxID=588581 RepID=F1T9P6_9FIRM|nr:CDP-diacylglycerol--glycerol-3-phosphate 3-phosphatidyltransferase [Ruminiclostridium papyrosolvens]EGD49228.1 CDP-alcohol phosphatidyltransferase [Ruminiclostridium papyrosolvens DSM 2782]WES35705.1 CDP-diacylglycerol--glycerol-3-phosphate 3-phosphatidyltransferase [Ruminiclostridium papyrosolvens DSM 2782]
MRRYIPNALTLLRLIIVPFLGYYIYCEKYTTAIILFAFGGFTDVLDGYIARKYNLITKWGKFFDPLADKLMQITALVFLVLHRFIPLIVLIIVVIKESLMLAGGIMLYKKGKTVIGANWYGKLATVIFYFAILATIIIKIVAGNNGYALNAIYVAIGLAVVCTLFALSRYIIIYFRLSKDYNEKKNK